MKIGLHFSVALLLGAHLLTVAASFVAPYAPERQHRENSWQPPSSIGFDEEGLFVRNPQSGTHARVHLFLRTQDGWKLFGAEEPGGIFLMGTDGLGRDQFSRLLHGARISLYSGLAAASVSAMLGFLLGGFAGFFGKHLDSVLMSIADLFLVLPWMYLLLAARAFFPLQSDPRLIFVVLLLVLGAIGWARPARIVRGVVMSTRERDYVLAARGFGAGWPYLLAHHVLPPALPPLLTYMSVAIPQYIAAEATLSFLGLGFSASVPSLGGLIASLASLEVLEHYWWMWAPAAVLAAILACYSTISNSLTAGGSIAG